MFVKFNSFCLIFILCSGICISCASAYMHTANDVSKTSGIIYMKDGTQKTGAISILLENGLASPAPMIYITPTGSNTEEQLKLENINRYVIDGVTYVAKHINLYTAGINHILFVKRLSEENDAIQFFELKQQRKSNDTGDEISLYFIGVPSYSTTDLIELHSSLLVPNFETKMSAFVADCPEIAEKIRNKEGNYFYGYMTPEFKKVEVIKRIVREYTNCHTK